MVPEQDTDEWKPATNPETGSHPAPPQVGNGTAAGYAVALVSLCGVVLSIAGVRAGGAMRKRLPEQAFRNLVLGVLGLAGAALVARGLG